MPAPRRAANRQEIEDAFSAFATEEQESILSVLTQVHRILKRERSRKADAMPTITLPTEWLSAPDPVLQQRIAGDTTPESHEN